jgi:hypothetical protein
LLYSSPYFIHPFIDYFLQVVLWILCLAFQLFLNMDSVIREVWTFGRVMLPFLFKCFVFLCCNLPIYFDEYLFSFKWGSC